MKKISVIVLLILVCAGPAVSRAADKIKIAMGYIPNVQFAPYYAAKKLGYFERENLDVVFDYGFATDIMSLVASGQVDFGVSDSDQVILARERGIPIKVIYTMYVRYPVGIVSRRELGIRDVAGLRGRKIGTPVPYGSNFIGLRLLLKNEDMDLDDIVISYIGYTQIETLLAGRVDAAVVFINNEPVVLEHMGIEVDLIEAYKITPMVSAAVIASENMIDCNPDLVRRFVRAVTSGARYGLENPDEVLDLIRSEIPTITDGNRAVNEKVLKASMELWMDEDSEGNGLGYTTLEDWKSSVRMMRSLGLLKKEIEPAGCFTNKFIVR